MKTSSLSFVGLVLFSGSIAVAETLEVPGDYPTIQGAIDAASDGDVVEVSSGTYLENINFLGKGILVTSVEGPASTVIDGGGQGSVVVFESGESEEAILRGFTITNGLGERGGGIHSSDSSPQILGNRIMENSATVRASGIYVHYGNTRIVGNVIENNTTLERGGGIMLDEGSVLIAKNIIRNNVSIRGSGIFIARSSETIIIRDNLILGNIASQGGGIEADPGGDATLLITNNIIAYNEAHGDHDGGGGVLLRNLGFFSNNTVFGNRSKNLGGGLAGDSTVHVTNCIFWGNVPDQIHGHSVVTYSNVQGGYSGEGNIEGTPRFRDPKNDDYHLLPGCPNINAGTNDAFGLPERDLDGDPRILNGTADIGADEFGDCIVMFEEFGEGTPGSWNLVPGLQGLTGGCDPGQSQLRVSNALGATTGWIWVGVENGELPFLGGTLYVDIGSSWFLLSIALEGSPGWPGDGHVELPLPSLWGFGDFEITLQSVLEDEGSPWGFTLTNGITLSVATRMP